MQQDADVVVVGAGLAGLACAGLLRERGLDVVVVERDDVVGGRIRTEEVDGYLVDRGFQVLNPAYPAVRRLVDVDALRPRPFGAGVAVRSDDGLLRLGHPLRAPRLLPTTARTAAGHLRGTAAVARWARELVVPRLGTTLADRLPRRRRRDVALGEALDRAGVDGLMRRVVDRFLAGVVLEAEQTTSDRYALMLVWMFVRGVPFLPERGMRALPEQLAEPLGDRVLLGTPVERVAAGAVHTAAGAIRGRAVVVATAGPEAAGLAGVPAPATRGVVTTWWSTPTPPTSSTLLHVDARTRARGPVVNCAVVSNAAPSYAPAGRHLVQASAPLGPGRVPAEAVVRRHAAEILGAEGGDWTVVARHEIPDALPAQPAPYSARRPVELGPGRFVCGDHRDTASIQGALVSGRRAARAVLAHLS